MQLNHEELIDAICSTGHETTYYVEGRAGIGKTYIANEIARRKGLPRIIFDCASTSETDLRIPYVYEIDGRKVMGYATNESLGLHFDRASLVCFDEIGKAPRALLPVIIPLLEQERRLGQHQMPAGTIVYATSNLGEEGYGDSLPGFINNRGCRVELRGATAREWLENFAIPNGLAEEITAFVDQAPNCLQDFREVKDPESNQYILHPASGRRAGCTHRSLHNASKALLNFRDHPVSQNAKQATLAGMLGERAAADIMALALLNERNPGWDEIISSPDKARTPEDPAAIVMMIHKAISSVDLKSSSPWFKYMKRLPMEAQTLFFTVSTRASNVIAIMNRVPEWRDFAKKNLDLFVARS